jgi:hypothetical protein
MQGIIDATGQEVEGAMEMVMTVVIEAVQGLPKYAQMEEGWVVLVFLV